MKVLMINFLRLGDVLMTAPIVDQIKRQHPNIQVHYLAFEEFKVAEQVLPNVDQWHFLSRASIRECMENLEEGLLSPVDLLQDLISGLNELHFDQAISLSHTLATSHMLSLLDAKQKFGTYFEKGKVIYSSKGFENLDNPDENSLTSTHYLDLYRKALGLGSSPVTWNFKGTELAKKRGPKKSRILIQPLSSDEKKGWTAESWTTLVDLIHLERPELDVEFICAPFEFAEVRKTLGPGFKISAVSLAEAFDLIEDSLAFITLDTSTKHLANGTTTPVIELFFGSGDFRKQSIYKPDSILMVPFTTCYPCSSKESCPLVIRQCAMDIDPLDVMKVLLNKPEHWGVVSARVFKTTFESDVCTVQRINSGYQIEGKNENRAEA